MLQPKCLDRSTILLLLLSHFSHVRLCVTPQTVVHQAPLSVGILHALTILGLVLAPVTAGASVALSATGIGLGAAAAVTAVSTSIVEHQKTQA